jgi:hypothetical protein
VPPATSSRPSTKKACPHKKKIVEVFRCVAVTTILQFVRDGSQVRALSILGSSMDRRWGNMLGAAEIEDLPCVKQSGMDCKDLSESLRVSCDAPSGPRPSFWHGALFCRLHWGYVTLVRREKRRKTPQAGRLREVLRWAKKMKFSAPPSK